MSAQAISPVGRVGYAAGFVLCSVVAVTWLVLGGIAAPLRYWPGLLGPAAEPDGRESLLVALARATEPLAQLLVDDGLSLVGIGAAVVLVVRGTRSWSVRLLALALVGSSAAFNLQSDAISPVLDQVTDLPLSATRGVALHALACVAFILALLLFPAPTPAAWWRARAATRGGRFLLAAAGGLLLVAIGMAAPLLPCALNCILFFGFVVPTVGVVVLPRIMRRGPTDKLRAQARLIFAVLVAALAANTVLGLSTLALSALSAPGLALADAESGDEPIAPVFWFSRASAITIAAVVLLAVLTTRLWRAERAVGRGLAAVLTVVVVGGAAVGVEALGWALALGGVRSSLLAAATAAVVFLPVHLLAENLSDRLLYGVRPTPYRALADIAHIAQTSASTGPDLDDIARAVGQALGATDCQITVMRHSLPDRTYRWPTSDEEVARPMASVPIRYGEEEIGTLAVERAAVGGLHADRRQLLEDIADGLGGVVAAYRIGVELERQLRAALAHGAEIAQSRRRAVSEMDAERRRIERDLHDGVQHHLVSLRLALGLVEFEVESGRIDSAVQHLETIAGKLDAAEDVLAETVGGVQSMLLAERGLVGALEAGLAGPDPVSVVSELPPGRRYPAEVESTVYFCCLEAVNNAAKHAPGASVIVRFAESDGVLGFTVTDDGPGFDPTAQPDGPSARGLRNLRQRIVGAGGRFDVHSAPGRGTTVDGAVPVPAQRAGPEADAPDDGSVHHLRTGHQATTVLRLVGPAAASDLSGVSIVTERGGLGRSDAGPAAAGAPGRPSTDLDDEITERLGDMLGQRGFDEVTDAFVRPSGDGVADHPAAKLDAERRGPGTGERTPRAPDRSLVAEIAALVAAVRAELGPGVDAGLAAVEASMRRPLRVGFLGPDGADAGSLMRCVLPAGPPPGAELVVAPVADADSADALVVLDGEGRRRNAFPPGLPTIVVVDDHQAHPGPAHDPAARVEPLAVVRIGWRIACAALQLTEADYVALRAGRPVARLGPDGNRLALALAREAPTVAELRAELMRRSRVAGVREALHRQVFARADLLRARRAVAKLRPIGTALPSGRAAERLRYGLERLLVSRPEFDESALFDSLHGGSATLVGPELAAAFRLLGATGSSTADRLGLHALAMPPDIELAARTELARWQRIAANPISPGERRHAATVLVRTCERILTRPPGAAIGRTSEKTASRVRLQAGENPT